MSDFQKMMVLLKPAVETIRIAKDDAYALLGFNQNRPSLDAADGSFTEDTWEQCRRIIDAFRVIDNAVIQLERKQKEVPIQ
jgi:hypothetical protein